MPARTHHLVFRLAVYLVMPLLATAVAAQTPADDASRAAERVQREQQELQRQQLEQQRRKLPAPDTSVTGGGVEVGADRGGPCREISEIRIGSAPNLAAAEQTRIVKSYAHRCLGAHDIEKLMAEITNSYMARGFVTTRVYLPQQDLTGGKLSVMVVEGVVERISLSGKDAGRIALANVLPGVQGQPLNLRDLEQGLDQINRLQSNHATFDVEPGKAPGATRILIHNQPQSAFHLGSTFDSMGQDSTGRYQAGITGAFDSPFGLNDYVSATYRQSMPLDGDRESKLGSATYLIPYGYSTWSLAYSRSDYTTFLNTASGAALRTDGDSEIASARFEDVLYRTRSDRVTFAAGLTTKSSHNYLADQLLAVSSRNLTVLDLSLNYATGFLGGVASLEGGYSRGLSIMGALDDVEGLPWNAPRAQFRRFNYSASYAVPFRTAGVDASFNSSFVGQRAQTPLYGTEQMLVGGIYSVRGFDRNALSGDNGYFWRNELAIRQPFALGPRLQATFRPFVAVDYGRTSMLESGTGTPEGTLSGATLGFSVSSGSFAIELFSSRAMHLPAFMEREGAQTYFRFTLSL